MGGREAVGMSVDALPKGRIPTVGVGEIVAALHRRRERRREAVKELQGALRQLSDGVQAHLARIAKLREAIELQGGDLSQLQYYDNMMARLRAELRAAERSLAVVFSAAAHGGTGV
jgi:small-conductance mechanosensitive channel